MNRLWEKVIADSDLVSLPQVYLKLQQVLYKDDFALNEVVEVISLDPAITARLLRMVNSSFFGLAARIETVSHAVNYLGAQQVHDLVLTASIAKTFSELNNPDFDLNRFWQSSVYNAIAARELAVVCNFVDSERLFVSGLLSHVGDLMMFHSLPEETREASQLAVSTGKPLYLAERELIGFDFAAIGAELLRLWHLPESLTEAIKYQLEPSQCEDFSLEASLLHMSGQLTYAFEQDLPIDDVITVMDIEAINLCAITSELLHTADKQVRENLDDVIQMLFPRH
ncbi:MAG: HDOD domain-containing protein [Gammaproteobacteria bacterium]|nr:HDOD domain-containing protein [Gammaproteobacteria bacterium]